MNSAKLFRFGAPLLCLVLHAAGEVRYVDLNSANPDPTMQYTNWSSAAVTIQDAIDASTAGDDIVVTDGVYQTGGRRASGTSTTNRVVVDKAVTVRSVNGPSVTVIQGQKAAGGGIADTTNAIRCVYLTNGAVLAGFTLTNGATWYGDSGGGLFCPSISGLVSNCVLISNSASSSGGGAYQGTLNNCVFTGNVAGYSAFGVSGSGGGAYSSTLNNCTLTGNVATGSSGAGGGANSGTLTNCILTRNSAHGGGGVIGATVLNSLLVSNSASANGGGAYQAFLTNCTLVCNAATYGGGAYATKLCNSLLTSNTAAYGGGAYGGNMYSCTIVGNSASNSAGGYSGQPSLFFVENCILYYNSALSNANFFKGSAVFAGCCSMPLASSSWCITNEPLFVDLANGNLRLASNSPCINAGGTVVPPPVSFDLDGNPRVVGGSVDNGAYECQSPALLEFYSWLLSYNLRTWAGWGYLDADGDGANNWQEWIAGTNPTNALSVLQMITVTPADSGLDITWQSVMSKNYFLERSTNLADTPSFWVVVTNLVGQAGTTSYTDTEWAGLSPVFYRVGVQNSFAP